jgi:hypothetical protein
LNSKKPLEMAYENIQADANHASNGVVKIKFKDATSG